MDERVIRLATPEACEKFAKNALRLNRPDLANEAQKRAIEIRAAKYGSTSNAERECLEAVFAYEEVLGRKNGKKTSASRTWQMIKRHGILAAAERAVNRETETVGYTALIEMGLQEFAFEAVILRYPELFSKAAVVRSSERVKDWTRRETL